MVLFNFLDLFEQLDIFILQYSWLLSDNKVEI